MVWRQGKFFVCSVMRRMRSDGGSRERAEKRKMRRIVKREFKGAVRVLCFLPPPRPPPPPPAPAPAPAPAPPSLPLPLSSSCSQNCVALPVLYTSRLLS
eukprot:768594-Hanusia_phi.AAC.1